MPLQYCPDFPDIAQEKSGTNFEQKDKILRNISLKHSITIMLLMFEMFNV